MTRKLKIILFVVLMITCSITNAQQSAAEDSLLSVIKLSQNDTSLWRHYNKLSSLQYNSNKYQKAYESGLDALKAAQSANNLIGITYAYQSIAMALEKLGKYKESEDYYHKSLELRERIGDKKLIAATCNNLGNLLNLKGDSENALKYQLRALKLREELQDSATLSSSYNNIALLQHDLGNDSIAIEYYNKAIKISEIKQNKKSLAVSYNNLGMIYRQTGKFADAIACYNKAIELNKELKNLDYLGRNYSELCSLYSQMADEKMESNQSESMRLLSMAVEHGTASFSLHEKYGSKSSLGQICITLSRVYIKMDSINVAEKYLIKALNILTETGTLKHLKDVYLDLSALYEKKAALKETSLAMHDSYIVSSLMYYKKYHALSDSLINENKLASINKITAQYETEKKDNEIKLLGKENELKSASIRQQGFSLQLAFLEKEKNQDEIVLLNKDKYLNALQLTQTQQELKNQELENKTKVAELELIKKDKLIQEKQLAEQTLYRNVIVVGSLFLIAIGLLLFNRFRLNKKIEGQQALLNERKRISNELHDDLGAQLSTARMFLNSMKNNADTDKNKMMVENSIQLIDGSINDLRKIMDDLQVSTLQEKGYIPATEELVNKINLLQQINFTLSHSGLEKRLEQKTEHQLFRITQELINNSMKYAKAKNVSIDLVNRDGTIVLLYEDDGIGFDLKNNKRGYGLTNIETRVKNSNGVVEFDSAPGKGARTIIEVPLKYA